jgi:hypothetical protein
MPLNEECGLLEWVDYTLTFRSICDAAYHRHGKRIYVGGLHKDSAEECCLIPNPVHRDLQYLGVSSEEVASRDSESLQE